MKLPKFKKARADYLVASLDGTAQPGHCQELIFEADSAGKVMNSNLSLLAPTKMLWQHYPEETLCLARFEQVCNSETEDAEAIVLICSKRRPETRGGCDVRAC